MLPSIALQWLFVALYIASSWQLAISSISIETWVLPLEPSVQRLTAIAGEVQGPVQPYAAVLEREHLAKVHTSKACH